MLLEPQVSAGLPHTSHAGCVVLAILLAAIAVELAWITAESLAGRLP